MRVARAGVISLLLAVAAGACAREEAPLGGPPDPIPPRLVRVTPESGSTVRRPSEVEFRFDEVVDERPSGVPSLEALVMISPRDGDPRVRWRREALSIRPRRGWRDSTTYVVTLLPGLSDLRGNVRDSASSTVFSTGGPIATTRITGAAFDWAGGTPLGNALIMGITRPREGRADSAIYIARAVSNGSFVLPYVRPGEVTIYAVNDQNSNYAVDVREAFDSTTVTLSDSLHVELYAFVQDSIGPQPGAVTVRDSVTLVVNLSRPLHPDDTLTTARIIVVGPDSQPLPIALVQRQAEFDSAQAAAAVEAQPDTAVAPPPPDTLPPAVADTAAARDTAAAPLFSRPIPASSIVIRLSQPLRPATTYEVRTRGLRNLLRYAADGFMRFVTPAPAQPQENAPPDSSGFARAGRR